MFQSFRNAFNGLRYVFQSERNFRIHIFIFGIAILLGFFLEITKTEWLIVLLTSFLVLSVEALNTSIEKLCDVVSKEYHPTIKIVKDVAAGAVVLIAIGACIVGAAVFVPYALLALKN